MCRFQEVSLETSLETVSSANIIPLSQHSLLKWPVVLEKTAQKQEVFAADLDLHRTSSQRSDSLIFGSIVS